MFNDVSEIGVDSSCERRKTLGLLPLRKVDALEKLRRYLKGVILSSSLKARVMLV